MSSAAVAQEAAPPPAADMDDGRRHDGFFLRLGLNVGPLILSAKTDPGGAEADYSGLTLGYDLLIGGTPVDGLVIGGALIAATTSSPTVEAGPIEGEADGTMIFAGIGAFANYYFDPEQGLHLQGLLGFAAVDFVSAEGQSGGDDPTGVFFGLGVGYDFWFADEWSVGPFARVIYAPTSVESGGVEFQANYLYPSIGAAITLH